MNEGPLWIEATFLPSNEISTSLAGSSRTKFTSRSAGRVVAPSVSIFASTEPVMPTSRSVVVKVRRPFFATSSTLERMGRVVRVLTTCWTFCSPSSRASLEMLNFMGMRVGARLLGGCSL